MACPRCGSKEVQTNAEIDDAGDLELTLCGNEDCEYVLRKERIVERADGSKMRKAETVAAEEQPQGLSPKGRGPFFVEEEIPTAEEMARLAVKMREETIGRAARDIVREVLKKAAEPDNILRGSLEYLVAEEDDVPAVVLKEAVADLRTRGYKPQKRAAPGEGTWLTVSWPTSVRKKRKKKGDKAGAKEETSQFEISSPRLRLADNGTAQKQAAAKKHRKKALTERKPTD